MGTGLYEFPFLVTMHLSCRPSGQGSLICTGSARMMNDIHDHLHKEEK